MIRIFGREPIVWLTGLQAILAVAVSIPAFGIDAMTAAWIVTLASAVLGAVEAWAVRPFTVAAMTVAVRTSAAALVMFGLPISPELAGAIVGAGTFLMGILVSNAVTPKADPDPSFLRGLVGTGRHS
jgi:hypothetical protein